MKKTEKSGGSPVVANLHRRKNFKYVLIAEGTLIGFITGALISVFRLMLTGADRLRGILAEYVHEGGVPAALLCAAGGLYFNTGFWMPPDWYALYAKGKAQAQGTLVIYSGTNGFPVMWNNQPDSTEENGSRLSQSTLDRLLCFTSDGILNGVDTSYSETHLLLKLKGLPHEGGFLYALESISEPADGDSVLLITCNGEKSLDTLLFNEISQSGRFLRLNIFFEVQKEEEFVNIIRGGVIDKAAAFDWKKLPEKMKLFRIKEMERKTP